MAAKRDDGIPAPAPIGGSFTLEQHEERARAIHEEGRDPGLEKAAKRLAGLSGDSDVPLPSAEAEVLRLEEERKAAERESEQNAKAEGKAKGEGKE